VPAGEGVGVMRYVELFAGAGGLSLGLEAAGMECVAHAELEPHARAVLRKHWPDTPLHGDVSVVDWTQYAGRVDLVSGGSPCQDLSVAGKRAGLEGARSGLFFELIRAWDETGATYCLWENVDGARSSNAGADFAAVLSAFAGAAVAVPERWASSGVAAGPTGVAAWRVLDLQHFGPPQRRRRVFVLAARAGGCDPAEILAVSEGVCGHPAPRERTGQGTARGTAGGVGGSDVAVNISNGEPRVAEVFGSLQARAQAGGIGSGAQMQAVLAFRHTQDPISGSVSPSIANGFSWQAGTGSFGMVPEGSPTLIKSQIMGVLCTTGHVTHASPIVLPALPASLENSGTGHNKDELIIAQHGQYNATFDSEVAPTLTCLHEQPYLVKKQWPKQIADTLTVAYAEKWGLEDQHINGGGGLFQRTDTGRPRRLTPLECERLMSWPDQWTASGVKEDGSEYALSDTARYRLCGNGVGSVVAAWIARRLVWAEAATAVERAA